ncbi:MAG: HAD family hydrolase [Nitrospinales bacterium]
MSFPFQAVLFDWSYTLVDLVKEDDAAAFRKLIDFMRKKGLQAPDVETFFPAYRELFEAMIRLSRQTHREACFEHVLNYFLLQWRIDLAGKTTVKELLTVYYREIYAPRKLFPDVLPVLQSLQAQGTRMGVVSNTTNPGFMKDFERRWLGLDSFFEFSIYSSQMPYRKPHPSIFKLAVKRLGLSPGDILFVGDSPETDVVGPRAVGMPVAWLNREKVAPADGIDPDYEINSLTELPAITVSVP